MLLAELCGTSFGIAGVAGATPPRPDTTRDGTKVERDRRPRGVGCDGGRQIASHGAVTATPFKLEYLLHIWHRREPSTPVAPPPRTAGDWSPPRTDEIALGFLAAEGHHS
jgi:hypothetical protein